MKLRTFTAADMPSAMREIRKTLGEDAVILATTEERGGRGVRVTAAIDHADTRTSFNDFKQTVDLAKRRAQNLDWQEDLRACLAFHRTPSATTARLLSTSESVDVDALLTLHKLAAEPSKHTISERVCAQVLARHFSFSSLPLYEHGRRFVYIGSEGTGKTLLTARCATEMVMKGHPVSVVTVDHKRAGGVDQLAAFTDILKLPLHIAASQDMLERILRELPVHHTVLVDTPGINVYDPAEQHALRQLASYPGVEPVVVLHAGMDAEESGHFAREAAALGAKRVVLTHRDSARRYGGLLAAADIAALAIAGSTESPRVVDALTPLPAETLAARLLEYRLHRPPKKGQ